MLGILLIVLISYNVAKIIENEDCLVSTPTPELLYSEELFSKDNVFLGEIKIYDDEDPTLVMFNFLSSLNMYSTELVNYVCTNNSLNCKSPILMKFDTVIPGNKTGNILIRSNEEPADIIREFCQRNNIMEAASYLTHVICNRFKKTVTCTRLKAKLLSLPIEIKIHQDEALHYKAILEIFENESPLDAVTSFTEQHNLGNKFGQALLKDVICQHRVFINDHDCDFDKKVSLTASSLNNHLSVFIIYCKNFMDGNIQNLHDELFDTFKDVWIIDCHSIINSHASYFITPPKIVDVDISEITFGYFVAHIIENIFSSSVLFIDGNIKSGFTNWKEMYYNLIEAVDFYNVGIYSIKDVNYSYKSHSKDRIIVKSNLEIIDDLEETSCLFISIPLISKIKTKPINFLSKLEFGGISKLLTYFAAILGGKRVVYDRGIFTSSNQLGNTNFSYFNTMQVNQQRDILIAYSLMSNSEIVSCQWSLFPKVHFASFGDSVKYKKSIMRIGKEAEEMKIFHSIEVYHEHSHAELESFFRKHQEFISNNKRGLGYWIWKPFVALLAFKSMKYNDILVYADSGCTLNKDGIPRMYEYVNYARVSDLVGFQTELLESAYSKGDLLNRLNCSLEKCLQSGQIMSGMWLMKKTERMEKFLYTFLELVDSSSYHFFSDEPSRMPNMPNFIEHRHDQSIFSILIKTFLHNRVVLLRDEGFVYGDLEGERYFNKNNPIIASRIRE